MVIRQRAHRGMHVRQKDIRLTIKVDNNNGADEMWRTFQKKCQKAAWSKVR